MSFVQPSDLPVFTNPLDCNVCYNNVTLNKFAVWMLTILFNAPFIYNIMDLDKMGRRYKVNDLQFCRNVLLSYVQGFSGQQITLYVSPHDVQCVNGNVSTLMRIFNVNVLPTQWGDNGDISIHVPPSQLNQYERIIYYYFTNRDFFINLLSSMKTSFTTQANNITYIKKFVFPASLFPGTLEERTIMASGSFLKQVYSYYLQRVRKGYVFPNRLPAPSTSS